MPGKTVAHTSTPFAGLITAPKASVRLERWEIWPKLRQTATGMEPVDDDSESVYVERAHCSGVRWYALAGWSLDAIESPMLVLGGTFVYEGILQASLLQSTSGYHTGL